MRRRLALPFHVTVCFFLICVCEDEVEKRNGPVRALFVSYTKRSLEAIFIF